MKYELTVRHYFDAAHQLPDTEHLITKACSRLHGHTYAVIVRLEADKLKGGMVLDFKAIKDAIDVLDHRMVNEVFIEHAFNKESTAENIAVFVFARIMALGFVPQSVSVCEGYKGEERASWATVKGGGE